MPGGDRTGPLGMGPMTGRAAGFCAGYDTPGYMNPIGGGGYFGRYSFRGRGGGRGRGWRHWYYRTGLPGWARSFYPYGYHGPYWPYGSPEVPRDQEVEMLREQARMLEKNLEDVRKRLEELESASEDE